MPSVAFAAIPIANVKFGSLEDAEKALEANKDLVIVQFVMPTDRRRLANAIDENGKPTLKVFVPSEDVS